MSTKRSKMIGGNLTRWWLTILAVMILLLAAGSVMAYADAALRYTRRYRDEHSGTAFVVRAPVFGSF